VSPLRPDAPSAKSSPAARGGAGARSLVRPMTLWVAARAAARVAALRLCELHSQRTTRADRGLPPAPARRVAQFLRTIARMMNTTSSYEKKSNLRILIITDYTPPQTHGIAIRFQHYITNMRKAGHEVQVYSTNLSRVRYPASHVAPGRRASTLPLPPTGSIPVLN